MNKKTTMLVIFFFIYLLCSFESISSAEKRFDIDLIENNNEHYENSRKSNDNGKDLIKNSKKTIGLKTYKLNKIFRNKLVSILTKIANKFIITNSYNIY